MNIIDFVKKPIFDVILEQNLCPAGWHVVKGLGSVTREVLYVIAMADPKLSRSHGMIGVQRVS